MAMAFNLDTQSTDERDEIEENYDTLADNPEHVAEGYQNSELNTLKIDKATGVERASLETIAATSKNGYTNDVESDEVATNYHSMADNPLDIADDAQEQAVNSLGVTNADDNLTEEEILYGGDENDYDYEYYDNADEFQTYDEQEITYHDDMDGQ